jgi:hypothetical protein
LKSAGAALLLLALTGGALGTGVMLALGARSEAAAELDGAEQIGRAKLRTAEKVRERAAQAGDLRVAVGHGRPLSEVVADLTWVATSKTPEARIVGVHWERGLLAVEARGEQAPFLAVDRPIDRSAKPIRPGVWLWAVGRPDSIAAGRGPVAAEVGP